MSGKKKEENQQEMKTYIKGAGGSIVSKSIGSLRLFRLPAVQWITIRNY